jgi:AraC-like DNA-binding protein
VGGISLPRALHRIGAYRELQVPAPLARLVDVAWVHRAPDSAMLAYPGSMVLPEPAVSLCFACQRDARGWAGAAELLLIGPVRTPRTYLPERRRSMAAVRVHPEWCRSILGIDPRDHTDALDDYAAIRPQRGRALLAELCATRSPRESLQCLFAFVDRASRRHRPDGTALLVHRGLRLLRRLPRPDGVGALADTLGISARHFRRVVAETCGLAPRDYARLERFRGVLRDADRADRPRWRDLAALHGYADQPHLSREARRLSGLPPRRLHAERRRCTPAAGT